MYFKRTSRVNANNQYKQMTYNTKYKVKRLENQTRNI